MKKKLELAANQIKTNNKLEFLLNANSEAWGIMSCDELNRFDFKVSDENVA